jgi:hypothetical protein
VGVSYGALAQPMMFHSFVHLKNPIVLGSLNLEYYYNFNKKHSIGAAFSVTSDCFNQHKWRSITNHYVGSENTYESEKGAAFFSIQLGYRFTFFSKNNISLYSSVFSGLGIRVISFHNIYYDRIGLSEKYLLTGHLTFLGMTIGKKNCVNIELGLGAQGILQIGYKYKFNSKNNK